MINAFIEQVDIPMYVATKLIQPISHWSPAIHLLAESVDLFTYIYHNYLTDAAGSPPAFAFRPNRFNW